MALTSFINSSDLLKCITLNFGISRRFKMESALGMYNIKPPYFLYSLVYISDLKLAAKTKIKKNWKVYI